MWPTKTVSSPATLILLKIIIVVQPLTHTHANTARVQLATLRMCNKAILRMCNKQYRACATSSTAHVQEVYEFLLGINVRVDVIILAGGDRKLIILLL